MYNKVNKTHGCMSDVSMKFSLWSTHSHTHTCSFMSQYSRYCIQKSLQADLQTFSVFFFLSVKYISRLRYYTNSNDDFIILN